MIVTVLAIVAGALTGTVMVAVSARHPLIGVLWFGANAVADVVLSALCAATGGPWGVTLWLGFLAAANAWFAWSCWNRHKRKRAPRALGAKSRARIAALVARARQAAKPRRVLRPVPGGAS